MQTFTTTVSLPLSSTFVNVMVNVPYRLPGNIVAYMPVEFEVLKDGDYCKAKPVCSDAKKRLINLPSALEFQVFSGKVVMARKVHEDVAYAIVRELNRLKIL